MQRQLQIQYNNRNANTSIIGTTSNYLEVRKFELEAGKMFTTGHDAARARVAVVGPAVAQLLGFDNPTRSSASRCAFAASSST
jgi:putative ABC transport system permease protein